MTVPVRSPAPPVSPCVGHCVLDAARSHCTGCARTLEEIAGWGRAEPEARAAVWAALPARAVALGLRARKLDWRGADLLAGVADCLRAGARLVAGVPGACMEIAGGADALVSHAGETLHVRAPAAAAALRLHAPAYLAAFEIAGDVPLVALAVPAGRAGQAGAVGPRRLGPDPDALLAQEAGAGRLDLGLGRRAARLSLRGAVPETAETLPLGDLLAQAACAVAVMETPCLRAEAPVTALDIAAETLAERRDLPADIPLPRGFALVAVLREGR